MTIPSPVAPLTNGDSMIVGSGLIASAFDARTVARLGAKIFASGVSNSSEQRAESFKREAQLLDAHLAECRSPFVYFSTFSIADPERQCSAYVLHKQAMEAKVAQASEFLILRLPQVVGRTSNPHTLTNFLAARILANDEFPVWESAVRCLIDVDDVARLTTRILETGAARNSVCELAPPETVSMDQLVKLMEDTLGTKAKYRRLARGGGNAPDSTLASRIGAQIGIDFSPGYTRRTLEKYYGNRHAD